MIFCEISCTALRGYLEAVLLSFSERYLFCGASVQNVSYMLVQHLLRRNAVANQIYQIQVFWNLFYIVFQSGYLARRANEKYRLICLQVGFNLTE